MLINSPRFLRRLRLGGFRDASALLGPAVGGLLMSPAIPKVGLGFGIPAGIGDSILGSMATYAAVVLSSAGQASAIGGLSLLCSAAGAATLTTRIQEALGKRAIASELSINSDQSPVKVDTKADPKNLATRWNGMLLGYCTDTGQPLVVDWENWMRHGFIMGQSGLGKTVLGEWIMFQQIAQGGGLLFIDGKLDESNLQKLNAMCCWAGRREDLLVINPGDPGKSNTYNPILSGDPDEVAARVLSLIPASEGNAGTDYYRQAANQGITTLVGAIQKTGKAYNFIDLTILLQNQKALRYLERGVPPGSEESKQLKLFLEQYKSVTKDGQVQIDTKKVRDTFGGVGGRMHQFGSGNFGEITKSYSPEVDLFEAIKGNKIVYVALPTMGKAEAASNFGKMVVGDFRTAISKVQALPKNERPWQPFLGFFDEAGSYVSAAWARIFEQSRSAHLVLLPAVQTIANLDAISEELREMVVGNTWTKCYFKIGTEASAKVASELIGTEAGIALSVSSSGGAGESSAAGTGTKTGVAQNDSSGVTEREEEVEKISTNALKALGKGEAIVTYGGSHVFHIKIPLLEFDSDFMKQIGPFELNRSPAKFVNGLNLFKDVNRWLAESDDDE